MFHWQALARKAVHRWQGKIKQYLRIRSRENQQRVDGMYLCIKCYRYFNSVIWNVDSFVIIDLKACCEQSSMFHSSLLICLKMSLTKLFESVQTMISDPLPKILGSRSWNIDISTYSLFSLLSSHDPIHIFLSTMRWKYTN